MVSLSLSLSGQSTVVMEKLSQHLNLRIEILYPTLCALFMFAIFSFKLFLAFVIPILF